MKAIDKIILDFWENEYVIVCHPKNEFNVRFHKPHDVELLVSKYVADDELIYNPKKLKVGFVGQTIVITKIA
jgi:hypothetical protein